MLVDLRSSNEICEYIKDKYSKSESVVRGYLAEALKTYKERSLEDIDAIRAQNQEHLLGQYRAMLEDYAEKKNPKYMSLAIQFYDRYLKLYPNGLEPEQKETESQLNIIFNKVDNTDDT
jgi:hypothetical protein